MIEQELIRAYKEYEELTQQAGEARIRLDWVKIEFAKAYPCGCYVVGDYVIEAPEWDGEPRVPPIKIHPITPLKSEVTDEPSN